MYPEKPNIIELIRIEFDDRTMQDMWRWFAELAAKQAPEKWKLAKNERKLTAFVKWMSKNTAEYERRKAEREKMASDPDLDSIFSNLESTLGTAKPRQCKPRR
jgi:hypothetical protein